MGENPRPVVLGVVRGQPDEVLRTASGLAARLGAELICATVNPARFLVAESADGHVTSASIDPDFHDAHDDELDPEVAGHLAAVLDPVGVRWSTRLLAGDPADALARLARTVDAELIVVGTHGPGRGIHELFNRSVAIHLAHRQTRPVVVVPAGAAGAAGPADPERPSAGTPA
ncbi:universal stress protein [Oerskovia turbata]|uniref:Universal stress protein n=1 Tax=Oerskovia turbata TaxID=1713 RepID=A0A4Q1L020_9CELL|nr:universal stress protein [Oerskovia turbata]RXR28084.1 universal stress protein [Oerskovia turbata]RXR35907.1 universal stress protein [Oerskovia turbata]TGJ94537.1 universal stress protein [Actinotalea fermentans ATCC 43279 = JCM 9966 = DSM 3133]